MKQFAVLISGNGSNLQAIIDSGLADNISIVISNRADAYGLQRAQRASIVTKVIEHQCYESRKAFDQALQEAIEATAADFIVLAGFMRILTDEFINRYAGRIINIHPSLLPKYKGLHTHRRVLEAGDEQHGPTVHFVVPELDSGPVIAQAPFDVPQSIDEAGLQQLVHQQEHIIYPQVIKQIVHGEFKCV